MVWLNRFKPGLIDVDLHYFPAFDEKRSIFIIYWVSSIFRSTFYSPFMSLPESSKTRFDEKKVCEKTKSLKAFLGLWNFNDKKSMSFYCLFKNDLLIFQSDHNFYSNDLFRGGHTWYLRSGIDLLLLPSSA